MFEVDKIITWGQWSLSNDFNSFFFFYKYIKGKIILMVWHKPCSPGAAEGVLASDNTVRLTSIDKTKMGV